MCWFYLKLSLLLGLAPSLGRLPEVTRLLDAPAVATLSLPVSASQGPDPGLWHRQKWTQRKISSKSTSGDILVGAPQNSPPPKLAALDDVIRRGLPNH